MGPMPPLPLTTVVGYRAGSWAGFSVKFRFFSVNRTGTTVGIRLKSKSEALVFGPVNRNRTFRLTDNTSPYRVVGFKKSEFTIL